MSPEDYPAPNEGDSKYSSLQSGAKNLTSSADDESSQGEETGQVQAEQLERPDAEPDEGNSGDLRRCVDVSHDFNDEQVTPNNLPAPIDADNATLPASYERAKQALAACESIDECKDWEDKAAALAAYGRMADDTELEKYALRIRAHAARRAGELLRAIPGETGGRPPRKKNSGGHSPEFSDASLEPAEQTMSPRAAAAKDAGMSEHQAKEAMRVAAVSKVEFERQVNGSTPPSVARLAKQGTHKRSLPTAPGASTHRAKADDHKNHFIGAEAVERALKKWQAHISPAQQNEIEVNTRERKAFVSAIERLPLSDAGWACELGSYVEQEARERDKAVPAEPARSAQPQ